MFFAANPQTSEETKAKRDEREKRRAKDKADLQAKDDINLDDADIADAEEVTPEKNIAKRTRSGTRTNSSAPSSSTSLRKTIGKSEYIPKSKQVNMDLSVVDRKFAEDDSGKTVAYYLLSDNRWIHSNVMKTTFGQRQHLVINDWMLQKSDESFASTWDESSVSFHFHSTLEIEN